jgi:DNA mismatch repair protein MutH
MTQLVYGEFRGETASEEEIVAFARRLRGKTLREVLPASGRLRETAAGDKGRIGHLVERVFGLPRSSQQGPDFTKAGIELKVVPLKRSSRSTRAKERTSVTMIDYDALVDESWSTAKVRKKLQKILFVFFFHRNDAQPLETAIEEFVLWTPPEDLVPQLATDWSVVRRKVLDGLAHEISEGDGRVLGAATKGAGGGYLVSQPRNREVRAKPRVWALKPALTTWLYEQERSGSRPVVDLRTALKLTKAQSFEDVVLERLDKYRGRTLAEIARALEVPLSRAKSGAAILVRRAIGVMDDRAAIREFKERGIQMKSVPVSPVGRPYEAMSFPKFNHMEVWKEEWDDSELLQHLSRLLIVPLIRDERKTPKEKQRWGSAFFWSPTADQLHGIECEWRQYTRLIEIGKAKELPGSSATCFIHVRPHARDSSDTEPAPKVGRVVKKCFWLNVEFVERVVTENGGVRAGKGGS